MLRQTSLTAAILLLFATLSGAETPNRVTILYDAFGKNPALTMNFGFAALVEYGGKRILFDTGNNAAIFEHNVKALGVDLRNLDFVVISHRHADHTSGISYLLQVNPKVKIYVPDELWGLFARGPKNDFYRKDASLPPEMRYYGGHPPEVLEGGTPWPGANFVPVSQKTEVAPGMFLLATVSSGLHQVQTPDAELERLARALHSQYKLERIAPGHCTGEPGFAALKKAFGENYVYAGVGTVIELPREVSMNLRLGDPEALP